MNTLKGKVNSLSELVNLALEDRHKVAKDNAYEFDVGVWHSKSFDDRDICIVRVAGCIIAKTLKANKERDVVPGHFDDFTSVTLALLESIRAGMHSIRSKVEFLGWQELTFDQYETIYSMKLSAGNIEEWEKLHKYLLDEGL